MAAKEFNQGVGSAPFNNLRIVSGESFIGGKLNVHTVRSNVVYGNNNCAIMGLPSVGKSSLAWEAVMAVKDELKQRKCLAVWLTAGAMSDSVEFYRSFCSDLVEEYAQVPDPVKLHDMEDLLKSVCASNDTGDIKKDLGKVIKGLTSQGYKTVLVVDGFDDVQRYMSSDDFGWLRKIFDLPIYNFSMITTSRKTIAHIESVSGSVSNFHQKFSTVYVGAFDDDSLRQYWNWAQSFLHTSDFKGYKANAERAAGQFPVLLNLFNKYFYDDNNLTVDENAFERELFTQFDAMEKMLKEKENLLDAAIQLVIGPVFNVKDEIKTLLDYGFIREVSREYKDDLLSQTLGPTMTNNVCYVCFSDFLTQEFVRRHFNDVQFWPEWQETERTMRNVILKCVTDEYGSNWEDVYEKAVERKALKDVSIDINSWKNNFKNMKNTRTLNQKRYQAASDNLTDYTSANTMFDLFINPLWNDWFNRVFSEHGKPGNKRVWKERFDHLAMVRHPNAHSTDEILSVEDKRLATQYCQQILGAISRWEKDSSKGKTTF